jgi:GNAT superfamily N-acetyltransferase
MSESPFVIERYADATGFLADTGVWLEADEARNNLVFSLGHLLTAKEHPFKPPVYLAAVKEAGRVVGCAVRPPPDHLDLTAMPLGAAALLGATAAAFCPGLKSLGGPMEVACEFARAWDGVHGGSWSITHRFVWLVLRTVQWPTSAPGGALALAEDADLPTIREWAPLVVRETGGYGFPPDWLERRLRTRSLYFWRHDGPRSMVAVSGFTPRGVRLSGVYTPQAHRRRGYAGAVVAAVSQRMLDEGRSHCVLFAEREREGTLALYERLGYERSHETVVIELGGPQWRYNPPRG